MSTLSTPTLHHPMDVAQAMYAKDLATKHLNIQLHAVGLGTAELYMLVREEMTNGHKTAHGGYIFTLADTAFAYACNSHNYNAVAADCSIQYLRPAYAGDTLRAVATETATAGRTGIYDIVISNLNTGEVVATFRGKSARIAGTHLPE